MAPLGRRGRDPARLAMLERARDRLDRLGSYPEPVRIDHVRLLVVTWVFRMPWYRRFDGYSIWHLILLRDRALVRDEDLIVHELCHVWQQQHGWIRMWLSYLVHGYGDNPYEREARWAAASTRAPAHPDISQARSSSPLSP